jgi:HEAT repeat protein
MAVTMEDVRAALDPEEPDYAEAAKLGPDALPHLEVLVNSGDTMLASKATYLASLIKDPRSADIVRMAANRDDPAMRVAAAAAASNLGASAASAVLVDLVGDPDPGVRKVARTAVPGKPTAKLAERLAGLGDEREPSRETAATRGAQQLPAAGLMPGETGGGMAGGPRSTMPGEQPGGMPGEQKKMPGE